MRNTKIYMNVLNIGFWNDMAYRVCNISIVFRSYSTVSPKPEGVKYDNVDTDKLRILSENEGKIGVYMWINLETGKRYIGSSVNLKRRFLSYYNVNRLMEEASMVINRALLKYGYAQFTL
jgi:hypothetical protein